MKAYKAFLIVVVILIVDQVSKFWIKTHMFLGQEIEITRWLSLHFTENPGMAFGMVLPGVWGKLFLSAFRLVAVGGGIYFIWHLIKKKSHWGFITASSMILAGALGNMIDGTFYGIVFSDSYMGVATFMPERGYAGFLQGLVVDMIHVKLFDFHVPAWVPGVGGRYYEFFPFIFNVADAAITIGVALILLFQKSFFAEEVKGEETTTTPATETQAPAGEV